MCKQNKLQLFILVKMHLNINKILLHNKFFLKINVQSADQFKSISSKQIFLRGFDQFFIFIKNFLCSTYNLFWKAQYNQKYILTMIASIKKTESMSHIRSQSTGLKAKVIKNGRQIKQEELIKLMKQKFLQQQLNSKLFQVKIEQISNQIKRYNLIQEFNKISKVKKQQFSKNKTQAQQKLKLKLIQQNKSNIVNLKQKNKEKDKINNLNFQNHNNKRQMDFQNDKRKKYLSFQNNSKKKILISEQKSLMSKLENEILQAKTKFDTKMQKLNQQKKDAQICEFRRWKQQFKKKLQIKSKKRQGNQQQNQQQQQKKFLNKNNYSFHDSSSILQQNFQSLQSFLQKLRQNVDS